MSEQYEAVDKNRKFTNTSVVSAMSEWHSESESESMMMDFFRYLCISQQCHLRLCGVISAERLDKCFREITFCDLCNWDDNQENM